MISSTMRRWMHLSSRWVMSSCPFCSPPFHARTIGICFHFLSVFPLMIPANIWKTRDSRRSNGGTALEDKHPSLGAGLKQICWTDPIVFVVRIVISWAQRKQKKITQIILLFCQIFCESHNIWGRNSCAMLPFVLVFFVSFSSGSCFTPWEGFFPHTWLPGGKWLRVLRSNKDPESR